jgi:phosphoribosylanthranilate isomerase
MLKTKVILLNVTNLSDARYAAGMGVEFIGFSINPVSNQYVTADDVNEITNWLSGVSMIGNIGSSVPSYKDYKVDYLLTDNVELVDQLDEPVLTVDLNIGNKSEIQGLLNDYSDKTSFFILKVKPAELQDLHNEIKELNRKFNCYMSTEFDDDNLDNVLSSAPSGIVLYGSHEEKPGLSNYDGIADVLELLEQV